MFEVSGSVFRAMHGSRLMDIRKVVDDSTAGGKLSLPVYSVICVPSLPHFSSSIVEGVRGQVTEHVKKRVLAKVQEGRYLFFPVYAGVFGQVQRAVLSLVVNPVYDVSYGGLMGEAGPRSWDWIGNRVRESVWPYSWTVSRERIKDRCRAHVKERLRLVHG